MGIGRGTGTRKMGMVCKELGQGAPYTLSLQGRYTRVVVRGERRKASFALSARSAAPGLFVQHIRIQGCHFFTGRYVRA